MDRGEYSKDYFSALSERISALFVRATILLHACTRKRDREEEFWLEGSGVIMVRGNGTTKDLARHVSIILLRSGSREYVAPCKVL